MSGGAEYEIGSEVSCSDGACGRLTRVVLDPIARTLTHLVVEPAHDPLGARLVPLARVSSSAADGIRLDATRAQFEAFEEAEESEFLPPEDTPTLGYNPAAILMLPYFGLGFAPGLVLHDRERDSPHAHRNDRIPVGEIEIRRGDSVEATDGLIGHVAGLVVDPADHHVAHFLLEEGHPWGRKLVAIPIGAVTEVGAIVRLSLSKDEVAKLPPAGADAAS